MVENSSAANEFEAIKKIHEELAPLEPDARKRVIEYLINLLDVDVTGRRSGSAQKRDVEEEDSEGPSGVFGSPDTFPTFADLFDAAAPTTTADKALLAGYWLQVHDGIDGFDSQTAHSLLKNLGHGVANITAALSSLREQKPALMLQIKKSGSSQQARKTYKVTVAGTKAVKDMIGRGEAS